MKKEYEKPEVNVIRFQSSELISVSGDGTDWEDQEGTASYNL